MKKKSLRKGGGASNKDKYPRKPIANDAVSLKAGNSLSVVGNASENSQLPIIGVSGSDANKHSIIHETQEENPHLTYMNHMEDVRFELSSIKSVKSFSSILKAKYGSVHLGLKHLDTNNTGTITLDKLSKKFRLEGLDRNFDRYNQRLLLEKAGANSSEEVSLNRLNDILIENCCGDEEVTLKSSFAVDKAKEDIKQAILSVKRRIKGEESTADLKKLISRSLILDDDSLSGSIDEDGIVQLFGVNKLNASVPEESLRTFSRHCSKNAYGEVDYEEFVKKLELQEHDPVYETFFDSQKHNLTMIRRRNNELLDSVHSLAVSCNAQKQAQYNSSQLLNQSKPWLDSVESCSSVKQEKKVSGNATPPLRIRPPPDTDWARVGYGGDGVSPSTSLFADSSERFKTTNNVKFPLFQYTRESSGIHVASRHNTISDSDREAAQRTRSRSIRYRARCDGLDRIMSTYQCEEADVSLKHESRVLSKTHQSLGHLETHNKQEEIHYARVNVMQKKPNPTSFKTMWNGNGADVICQGI